MIFYDKILNIKYQGPIGTNRMRRLETNRQGARLAVNPTTLPRGTNLPGITNQTFQETPPPPIFEDSPPSYDSIVKNHQNLHQ